MSGDRQRADARDRHMAADGAQAPADEARTAPTVTGYARTVADYAPSAHPDGDGALVVSVRPESPADDIGIEPGMRVLTVNGRALTDMIVWLWEADGEIVALEVLDPRDGTVTPCDLERLPGEDWGLEFDGAVFDGMRTCVNGCIFCFMTMLPRDMRSSLYIRDDDYRLSFLQGNFVTLTNMSDDDVADAIERRLSPMNVSLHAITPRVRRALMGKNAQRGLDVLGALMDAGLEIHAQIVLCPGINDGAELDATLAFAEAHPQITSMGIVPLGYTRFQKRFTSSYSSDPAAARAVIEQVRPYQERARARCGASVFQLSDEFYLDARVEPPAAEFYDGYPQYYDGIGMIRSYLDDAADLAGAQRGRLERIARALDARGRTLGVVTGCSPERIVRGFVEAPPLSGAAYPIVNEYFGGNVDVTGLICGCDLLGQLPDHMERIMLFVPSVMFNANGMTLDGYHQDEIRRELARRGAEVLIASTMPYELVETLENALDLTGSGPSVKERAL